MGPFLNLILTARIAFPSSIRATVAHGRVQCLLYKASRLGSGSHLVKPACQTEERSVSLQSRLVGRLCFCYNKGMKVLFVAGYGAITTETKESVAFYRE